VVGLAHWPNVIAPGVSGALLSSLDYLPTIAAVTGATLPTDRDFDGIDMSSIFKGQISNTSGHTTLFHPLSGACGSGDLMAARLNNYKAHWVTGGAAGCGDMKASCTNHDPPLLFDLDLDPAEAVALDTTVPKYAAIVKQLTDARASKKGDVQSTARSTADYSSSAAGRKANCCNEASFDCACNATGIGYSPFPTVF
jgi:arylsulfatase A-like enzyme